MESRELAAYFTMLLKAADEFRKLISPFPIDKMAGHYSKRLDNLILRVEREQSLHYVGGEFIVTAETMTQFKIAVDLYFQDEAKEWVRVQTESGLKNIKYLNEASRRELLAKRKIVFEVQEPGRGDAAAERKDVLPRRK